MRDADGLRQVESERAIRAYRWSGVRLDHLRPLAELRALGCTLDDVGAQQTIRGDSFAGIRIALDEC